MTQTETTTRPETETTDDVEPVKRGRIELSLVQLFAGALAAMTAAVIGSRLGVSGTVVGAAIGSIVAGITGSLYSASLQRGRQVIAKAPLAVKAAPTLVMRTRPTASRTTVGAVPPGVPTQAALAGEVEAEPRPRRRAWTRVLISAAAVFLLAGLGITAFELATGQSLSGREGTTISEVGSGGAAPAPHPADELPAEVPTTDETPTEEPSESPSDPAETPSETPSEEPTEPPSETPTEAPSEEPSEAPTEDPSAPPTDEPSESPTATW
ncbi:hypothetical protein [Pseudactinotalea suaedae]|uniref:hypothetical protein n=1 Tax=Pseudactinotalea suaedae TaxID=1524924 RepID=UPI0012E21DE7|nr:hypothetical protein [Pseudactinotalea suaedae]